MKIDASSPDIFWQNFSVSQKQHSQIKGHPPKVIWLTGLSGSGKSTIAGLLEAYFNQQGIHTSILDGDNVRHGLCQDLGFLPEDRQENIRRVGEVAKLFFDAGLVVIASFISPLKSSRSAVRALFRPSEFVEVFIDCDLDVCEQRDPKGLYREVRRGKIKNFTGISAPYERPENAELIIDSSKIKPEESAMIIIDYLNLSQWRVKT